MYQAIESYSDEIKHLYIDALQNDARFKFKSSRSKTYLEGTCPRCKQKSVFVKRESPWRVTCNRQNKCAWSETTNELYPDVIDSLVADANDAENPKAKADAYMRYKRGFDISKINGWYEQEAFHDPKHNITDTTVRFWLDKERNCYWERLISKSKSDGQRQNIRGRARKLSLSDPDYDEFDGTKVKGIWWTPPGQVIEPNDTVYLVEGIFHAIAFYLNGHKVAATIASGYYPELALRPYYGKSVLWIWALDDDEAGRKFTAKHRKRMESKGERTAVALTGSDKQDWDDFYKLGEFRKDKPGFLEQCIYRGQLEASRNMERKAFVYFRQNRRTHFLIEYRKFLYSVTVNTKELNWEELDQTDTEQEYNHKYVPMDFSKNIDVREISMCVPEFLYAERNQFTRELSFFVRIDFANGAPRIQESLKKEAMESAKAFHKAIVGVAVGASFRGSEQDFCFLHKQWFSPRSASEEVRSVNYMGYDKEFGGYVFRDYGFREGKFIPVDEIGLIQGDGERVKSSLKDINFVKADSGALTNWLRDFYLAFGVNGLVTIAFWFGSFFSEQIRAKLGWFPFLEMSGKPGTGKSSIIEFLWKASGREGAYEGINPTKYSQAGRGKVMTKLAGMPMVLIEGDTIEAKNAFDINEMKDAFNGRPVRGIGLPTGGSETIEPPFKCGLIVAQNDEIDCEKAMISRFVHLHWTTSHFSQEGSRQVQVFKDMETEQAAGFMFKALSNESAIMESIFNHYQKALPAFRAHASIKMERIQEIHALVVACFQALSHVFGEQVEAYHQQVTDHLLMRAQSRQQRMVDDHPDVELFWEIYELLNVRTQKDPDYVFSEKLTEVEQLNHSADDQLIAINLVDFRKIAEQNHCRLPEINHLKTLLKNSTKYKFIDTKSIRSKIKEKSVFCWVFTKPKRTTTF